MNKKFNYIINGVLGVAVIVLFVLQFMDSSCETAGESPKGTSGELKALKTIPIAYVDLDTLLSNYNFAKESSANLVEKTEKAQLRFSKKMTTWQKEGAEFQRKLQSNLFLSRERAEQENARLMQKRQELEELGAKLEQEYIEDQRKIDQQLTDTIRIFLKEFNKDNKYQMILSNSALYKNILNADTVYNITDEVIELLNARCQKKKE